jgi:hypothetical protein
MKKLLIICFCMVSFPFIIFSDEKKDAATVTSQVSENDEIDSQTHQRKPSHFSRKLPTGLKTTVETDLGVGGFNVGGFKFHEIGKSFDAQAIAGGKVAVFSSERSDDQKNRAALITRLNIQFGALSSELQLNFTKAFSRALYHKFKEQGDVQATDLDRNPAEATLEKLTARWDAFSVEGEGGERIVSVSVVAGRDQATPVGSFVSVYRTGMPAVQSDRINQTDLIKVVLEVFRNTVVEFVTYGYDALGYPGDSDRDFNQIEQEGNGSRAINIKHKIDDFFGGELTLYFSYASSEEGFVNVNRELDRQRPAQETYAAGARYVYIVKILPGRFTAGAEYAHQSNQTEKDEDAVSGSVEFDSFDYPISGYATVDWQRTLFADEDGLTWTLGAAYHLFDNMDIFLELEYVDPEIARDEEDKLQFNYGFAISPSPFVVDLTPDKEKRHE